MFYCFDTIDEDELYCDIYLRCASGALCIIPRGIMATYDQYAFASMPFRKAKRYKTARVAKNQFIGLPRLCFSTVISVDQR